MFKKSCEKVYSFTCKSLDYICICLLFILIILVFSSVFMRYIFNSPIRGAQELSIYLLLWFGFLGIIKGHRDNHHIRITFLADKLSKRWKRYLEVFSEGIILIFSVIMFFQGLKLVEYDIISPLPATGIPSSTLAFLIVIVGFMLTVQSILKLVFVFSKEEN